MPTPYQFTPHVPVPPHPTPASASAYSLPNPKALRPPIHNPYDKFTQPEFDAWIGGITGALRHALGQDDERPHSQNGDAIKHMPNAYSSYTTVEDEESADEHVDDSFADFKARRAAGKGKARDPREGPGLGKGDSVQPIEIASSDEEEEHEVELSVALLDDDEKEDDEEEDFAPEQYAWERGQSSSQPLSSPEKRQARRTDVQQGKEEEYEDDEVEDEAYGDEEEYDEDEECEEQPRGSSPQVIELISDDDEEEVPAQVPKPQAGAVSHEEYEEDDEDGPVGHDEYYEGYSEEQEEEEKEVVVPPPTSISRVHASGSVTAHPQPEYDEDEEEYDDIQDDDDDDGIQEIHPNAFHQHSTHSSSEQDPRIEIRDPWEGPRTYAEDYYSGGDVRPSGSRQMDAHHLGGEDQNRFEDAHASQDDDIDDEIQPLSQDTSFPPQNAPAFNERNCHIEIPDQWSGSRHHAQDFYSGGRVVLPSDGSADPNRLGPGDSEFIDLDAEEEELAEEIEDEIQPLDADTSFPPQEHPQHGLPNIPDQWMGPQIYAEDYYSSGDVSVLPGERVDPFELHGTGDLDDGIDSFLTPGALSAAQSVERTSVDEEEEEGVPGPPEHYENASPTRNEPIPPDAGSIIVDDSDEEPIQEEKPFEEIHFQFEEADHGQNHYVSEMERASEMAEEDIREVIPPPPAIYHEVGDAPSGDSTAKVAADGTIDMVDEGLPTTSISNDPHDIPEIASTDVRQLDDDAVENAKMDEFNGPVPINFHHDPPEIVQPTEIIEPESTPDPQIDNPIEIAPLAEGDLITMDVDSKEHDSRDYSDGEEYVGTTDQDQVSETIPVVDDNSELTGDVAPIIDTENVVQPEARVAGPPDEPSSASLLPDIDLTETVPAIPSNIENEEESVEHGEEVPLEQPIKADGCEGLSPVYTVIEALYEGLDDNIRGVDEDMADISVITVSDAEEWEMHRDKRAYSVEEAATDGRLTEEPPDRAMSLGIVSIAPDESEDVVMPAEQADSVPVLERTSSPVTSPELVHMRHDDQAAADNIQEETMISTEPTQVEGHTQDTDDMRHTPPETAVHEAVDTTETKAVLPDMSGPDEPQYVTDQTPSIAKPAESALESHSLRNAPRSPPATPPPSETPLAASTPVSLTTTSVAQQQPPSLNTAEGQHPSYNGHGPFTSMATRDHVLSSINEAFFGSNLPNYFSDFYPAQQLASSNLPSVLALSNEPSDTSIDEKAHNVEELQESTENPVLLEVSPECAEESSDNVDDKRNNIDEVVTQVHTPPFEAEVFTETVGEEAKNVEVDEDGPSDAPTSGMPIETHLDEELKNPEADQGSLIVASVSEVPSRSALDDAKKALEGPIFAPFFEVPPEPRPNDTKTDIVQEPTAALPAPSTEVVLTRPSTVPPPVFDAYPYNLSAPSTSIPQFTSPIKLTTVSAEFDNTVSSTSSTSVLLTQSKESGGMMADKSGVADDWDDLEFQYPSEQAIIAEFKDAIPSVSQLAKGEIANPVETSVKASGDVKKAQRTTVQSHLNAPDVKAPLNPKDVAPSLTTEAEDGGIGDSKVQFSPVKTSGSSKRAAKRKRDTSQTRETSQAATKPAGSQKSKGRKASKSDRKGKSQEFKAEIPEPTSEETIHVRPRTAAQMSAIGASTKPAETVDAFRMLQPAARASSTVASDPNGEFTAQASPTTNKPNKFPVQPLPPASLFHAHGKARKQLTLSSLPPKLAKQVQSRKLSPAQPSTTPKVSEPLTPSTPSVSEQSLPPGQNVFVIPPLTIPTSNVSSVPSVVASATLETSPAPLTPSATSPAPITPVIASHVPLPQVPPSPNAAISERTPSFSASAAHTPSHHAKPTRSASMTSSPVTRSHCRYHRISLPKEENGPRVWFLVPGCSLTDKELMEEEEIEDHGDAMSEDSHRMIKDLDSLNFHSDLIGILRQLVGLDILREQEVYYLPQSGEEVPHRNSLKKSLTEKSAMVRVSADSSSYAGSPEYSGVYAGSPGSFKAPTVTSGTASRSPSISGLRSFLDSEKGSSYAATDTELSDGEEPAIKRSRPSPPGEHGPGAMGPPASVQLKGKEKAKRSRKSKTKSGGEGAESSKKPRKSSSKRGVKRSRTSEAFSAVDEDEPNSKKLKAHPTDPGLSPEKPPPS